MEGTFYHLSVKQSPVMFLGGGFGQWPPIFQIRFCEVEESQESDWESHYITPFSFFNIKIICLKFAIK